MVFWAVDSALVLLSSHLSLSSPAFLSGMLFACLISLGIWLFCDACLLPWMRFVLVSTCPLCDSCHWCFLVWLASWSTFGAHTWGVPFMVGSRPPLCVCGWQFPACVSLCTIHVHCSYAGVRCFAWFIRAYPGLLALQGLGVLPFFFFLRPLLFRFSFSRFLGFAVPLVVPVGVFLSPVAFLPWPAYLSLGPGVS